jgi:hypothetical protein
VLGVLYREALVGAEVEDPDSLDLFHVLRHSSLTNGAAAGMSPVALQARAGHSSFATTCGYLALAGVGWESETAKHSDRLWGRLRSKTPRREWPRRFRSVDVSALGPCDSLRHDGLAACAGVISSSWKRNSRLFPRLTSDQMICQTPRSSAGAPGKSSG